ncbi:MAG: ABC transporter ATP-binding protein/permease [Oscillospiraceae bacterium]|nr:ABC transporter ATP-binding protein/permease [Oscillospiraceae bacterium]
MSKNLKAFLRYTKGYRLPLIFSFVIMIAEMLVSFVSPLVMSVTIDTILGGLPLDVPVYFEWYARLITERGTVTGFQLPMMGLTMVALTLVTGLMQFIRAWANNSASEGVVKRLRDRVYAHVQRLPFKWHAEAQTGDIIQRATNDVEQVRRFLQNSAVEFLRIILMLIVGIWVMFSMNVQMALTITVMLPPVALVSVLFFNHITKLTNEQEAVEGKLFSVIQENLSGTRVVRAFGRQQFEMEKFDVQNEDNRARLKKLNNAFATLWSVLDVIMGVAMSLMLIVGVVLVVNAEMTVGQFAAFSLMFGLVLWPLRGFGRVINTLSHTLVAVGRIEEVLNAQEESGLDDGETPTLTGDIEFIDAEFGYTDDSNVLKKLNMTIPAGKTVAFLGGTGSGKSTLALLLPRLYDLNGGSIKIGGNDVSKIRKTYLRDKIGIVLQEPFLYSKTIRENIGIKLKDPDLDVVQAAAIDASIHDDIMTFADGYETVVGERGVTLSGGQKQRVAIARALTGDSDILIFDDSLSAVDTKTDASIRAALKKRRENVTTLIISHRVATLMEADKIFVLKDGVVAEQGSHDELMEFSGIYRRTYDIQNATAE